MAPGGKSRRQGGSRKSQGRNAAAERLKAAPPPFEKKKRKVGGPPPRPASHTDTRVRIKQNFIFKKQHRSLDDKAPPLEGATYHGAKKEIEEALQKLRHPTEKIRVTGLVHLSASLTKLPSLFSRNDVQRLLVLLLPSLLPSLLGSGLQEKKDSSARAALRSSWATLLRVLAPAKEHVHSSFGCANDDGWLSDSVRSSNSHGQRTDAEQQAVDALLAHRTMIQVHFQSGLTALDSETRLDTLRLIGDTLCLLPSLILQMPDISYSIIKVLACSVSSSAVVDLSVSLLVHLLPSHVPAAFSCSIVSEEVGHFAGPSPSWLAGGPSGEVQRLDQLRCLFVTCCTIWCQLIEDVQHRSGKAGAKDNCLAPLLGRLLSCTCLIHFLLFASPQLPSHGGGRLPFGRDRESSSSLAGRPHFLPSGCGSFGSSHPSASFSSRLSCRVPLSASRSDGCSSAGVSQLLVLLMLEQRRAKEVQRLETATGPKALTKQSPLVFLVTRVFSSLPRLLSLSLPSSSSVCQPLLHRVRASVATAILYFLAVPISAFPFSSPNSGFSKFTQASRTTSKSPVSLCQSLLARPGPHRCQSLSGSSRTAAAKCFRRAAPRAGTLAIDPSAGRRELQHRKKDGEPSETDVESPEEASDDETPPLHQSAGALSYHSHQSRRVLECLDPPAVSTLLTSFVAGSLFLLHAARNTMRKLESGAVHSGRPHEGRKRLARETTFVSVRWRLQASTASAKLFQGTTREERTPGTSPSLSSKNSPTGSPACAMVKQGVPRCGSSPLVTLTAFSPRVQFLTDLVIRASVALFAPVEAPSTGGTTERKALRGFDAAMTAHFKKEDSSHFDCEGLQRCSGASARGRSYGGTCAPLLGSQPTMLSVVLYALSEMKARTSTLRGRPWAPAADCSADGPSLVACGAKTAFSVSALESFCTSFKSSAFVNSLLLEESRLHQGASSVTDILDESREAKRSLLCPSSHTRRPLPRKCKLASPANDDGHGPRSPSSSRPYARCLLWRLQELCAAAASAFACGQSAKGLLRGKAPNHPRTTGESRPKLGSYSEPPASSLSFTLTSWLEAQQRKQVTARLLVAELRFLLVGILDTLLNLPAAPLPRKRERTTRRGAVFLSSSRCTREASEEVKQEKEEGLPDTLAKDMQTEKLREEEGKDSEEGNSEEVKKTGGIESEQTSDLQKQHSGSYSIPQLTEKATPGTAQDKFDSDDGGVLPAEEMSTSSVGEEDDDDDGPTSNSDSDADVDTGRMASRSRDECSQYDETGVGQFSISLLPLALLIVGVSPVELNATLPNCLQSLYGDILLRPQPLNDTVRMSVPTLCGKCRKPDDPEKEGMTSDSSQTAHLLPRESEPAEADSLLLPGVKLPTLTKCRTKLHLGSSHAKRRKVAARVARFSTELKEPTETGPVHPKKNLPRTVEQEEGFYAREAKEDRIKDKGGASDRRNTSVVLQSSSQEGTEEEQVEESEVHLENELAVLAGDWGRLVGVASIKVAAATVGITRGPGGWTSASAHGDRHTERKCPPFSPTGDSGARVLEEVCGWLLCMARHSTLRAREEPLLAGFSDGFQRQLSLYFLLPDSHAASSEAAYTSRRSCFRDNVSLSEVPALLETPVASILRMFPAPLFFLLPLACRQALLSILLVIPGETVSRSLPQLLSAALWPRGKPESGYPSSSVIRCSRALSSSHLQLVASEATTLERPVTSPQLPLADSGEAPPSKPWCSALGLLSSTPLYETQAAAELVAVLMRCAFHFDQQSWPRNPSDISLTSGQKPTKGHERRPPAHFSSLAELVRTLLRSAVKPPSFKGSPSGSACHCFDESQPEAEARSRTGSFARQPAYPAAPADPFCFSLAPPLALCSTFSPRHSPSRNRDSSFPLFEISAHTVELLSEASSLFAECQRVSVLQRPDSIANALFSFLMTPPLPVASFPGVEKGNEDHETNMDFNAVGKAVRADPASQRRLSCCAAGTPSLGRSKLASASPACSSGEFSPHPVSFSDCCSLCAVVGGGIVPLVASVLEDVPSCFSFAQSTLSEACERSHSAQTQDEQISTRPAVHEETESGAHETVPHSPPCEGACVRSMDVFGYCHSAVASLFFFHRCLDQLIPPLVKVRPAAPGEFRSATTPSCSASCPRIVSSIFDCCFPPAQLRPRLKPGQSGPDTGARDQLEGCCELLSADGAVSNEGVLPGGIQQPREDACVTDRVGSSWPEGCSKQPVSFSLSLRVLFFFLDHPAFTAVVAPADGYPSAPVSPSSQDRKQSGALPSDAVYASSALLGGMCPRAADACRPNAFPASSAENEAFSSRSDVASRDASWEGAGPCNSCVLVGLGVAGSAQLLRLLDCVWRMACFCDCPFLPRKPAYANKDSDSSSKSAAQDAESSGTTLCPLRRFFRFFIFLARSLRSALEDSIRDLSRGTTSSHDAMGAANVVQDGCSRHAEHEMENSVPSKRLNSGQPQGTENRVASGNASVPKEDGSPTITSGYEGLLEGARSPWRSKEPTAFARAKRRVEVLLLCLATALRLHAEARKSLRRCFRTSIMWEQKWQRALKAFRAYWMLSTEKASLSLTEQVLLEAEMQTSQRAARQSGTPWLPSSFLSPVENYDTPQEGHADEGAPPDQQERRQESLCFEYFYGVDAAVLRKLSDALRTIVDEASGLMNGQTSIDLIEFLKEHLTRVAPI
ncbi:hypothetical protein CSUI_005312 [Cystoisospora suis]|uniref:Uncharacterized protein n=1 Tax=Cystoisospora suis TaxID=483139 RepID=A0A2C6KYG2_9APIC|nr:hypothetical protein CSUI_005312 [Cystoisospora suis]